MGPPGGAKATVATGGAGGGGGAGPSESIPDQSGSTNHAHRPPAVMIRP